MRPVSERAIAEAARALKVAHVRADVLGGEHQAAVAEAYATLLEAVGDVDEPDEITAYRKEVASLVVAPAEEARP
jgi:hypothetical protein